MTDVLVNECTCPAGPDWLASELRSEQGLILLRSGIQGSPPGRYSMVTARPFLTFRSSGSACETRVGSKRQVQFGNPWQILDDLMARYELGDALDMPFPQGGCFGYWSYDLKQVAEPQLPQRAIADLALPDCHLGFYASAVVFDHHLERSWIISTGLTPDGSRDRTVAQQQLDFWRAHLEKEDKAKESRDPLGPTDADAGSAIQARSTRAEFLAMVERVKQYIQAGDVYQVNIAQRFSTPWTQGGWQLFSRLSQVSPAPYSAYLDCGEFQIISASPELFLRLSGTQIVTRPIKGTRPRGMDPTRDAQLAYELQTSPKEQAELVMITDLLRNDLGKVCEYGSVHVPDLFRLERYAQVQHLVATVEGQLRSGTTHPAALAACFPGGSITGAPKIRAMEIIDELEPVTRGPYTGALGYLGFNRESQLSILIRTAVCANEVAYFHAGAGIVADSDPGAEYEETLAKASGFFEAVGRQRPGHGWTTHSRSEQANRR